MLRFFVTRISLFAKQDNKSSMDWMQWLLRTYHHGILVVLHVAFLLEAVEGSVAEKVFASPTSALLEGFMWDKETEVDRFRERVPLSNLVFQWQISVVDPSKPKPRDWLGPVKEASTKGSLSIIPEYKRMEPGTGRLCKHMTHGNRPMNLCLQGFHREASTVNAFCAVNL